jgi:aminopeptidase N
MKSQDRTIVYLKDYHPPTHQVLSLDLQFDLFAEGARVTNTMKLRPLADSKGAANALVLDGQNLKLESIQLNGADLPASTYTISGDEMTVQTPAAEFSLEIVTWIEPQNNTELSGLYRTKDMFCTQCEAQGFRRITYFLDRPDVMTMYTTTIRADRAKYPVLLSNGNKVADRILPDGRREVTWNDPFKKPSYLFALVAGDLACIEDHFVTMSGRRVTLQIFVEHGSQDRVAHAMESLKKSMAWDEKAYGREYDLDIFMIVAADDFNSGAMENKGLNIFNSKLILASPETATDGDFEAIEGVVAHEYFHNWTGNRITCRDWFQLSLKEGLTVFRDQEFSSDMNSRAVKRIEDVNMLRTHQFAEDAGPMAHPIRPASYMEINNFYTLTVYEKGSEVIRMIHTLLGPEIFRKGMDKYFELFDGQAVTTEDFVRSMELASNRDLTQFKNWYNQAGTPEVYIDEHYDSARQILRVNMRQTCRPTPETPEKKPFVIPVKTALVADTVTQERVLELTEFEQSFTFENVPQKPVVSYLRGFSAPVRLHTPHKIADLLTLLAKDNDSFQRWESLQNLWNNWIFDGLKSEGGSQPVLNEICLALAHALKDPRADEAMKALLLIVPSEVAFIPQLNALKIESLFQLRQQVMNTIAKSLQSDFARIYDETSKKLLDLPQSGTYSSTSAGLRALKNASLRYLIRADHAEEKLAWAQLQNAKNMTDQFDALVAMAQVRSPKYDEASQFFRTQWQDNYLVINKWLAVQANIPELSTCDRVMALTKDKQVFDLLNPNKVYSLLVAYSQHNAYGFHGAGKKAYDFIADTVIELDRKNPQVASRLVRAFNHWKRFANPQGADQQTALSKIANAPGLSRNVFEIVSRALE